VTEPATRVPDEVTLMAGRPVHHVWSDPKTHHLGFIARVVDLGTQTAVLACFDGNGAASQAGEAVYAAEGTEPGTWHWADECPAQTPAAAVEETPAP